MDLTKGMECPSCGTKQSFIGGSFGGGINSTNYSCDCGFKAWLIIKQNDYEYEVSASPTDRKKANPYKDKEIDEIIIEKHYLKSALDKTINYTIRRSLQIALGFIDDILKEKN